jgi:hypothetical protein
MERRASVSNTTKRCTSPLREVQAALATTRLTMRRRLLVAQNASELLGFVRNLEVRTLSRVGQSSVTGLVRLSLFFVCLSLFLIHHQQHHFTRSSHALVLGIVNRRGALLWRRCCWVWMDIGVSLWFVVVVAHCSGLVG